MPCYRLSWTARARSLGTSPSSPTATSTSNDCNFSQIMPVMNRYALRLSLLMSPLLGSLQRPQHDRPTRYRMAGLLAPPRLRLSATRRAPVAAFTALFNGLPVEIRDLIENQYVLSVAHVKISLRRYFAELDPQFVAEMIC